MKIEDLTLKEIREICDKRGNTGIFEDCKNICPIYGFCWRHIRSLPSEWTTEDMERDIEGVNK